MSVKVLVYGHSDDLVEFETDEGKTDEFNLETKDYWTGKITTPDGQEALIYVDYRQNGTWTVSFGLTDEDEEFPDWDFSLSTDNDLANPYTVIGSFTVPKGTVIQSVSSENGKFVV